MAKRSIAVMFVKRNTRVGEFALVTMPHCFKFAFVMDMESIEKKQLLKSIDEN